MILNVIILAIDTKFFLLPTGSTVNLEPYVVPTLLIVVVGLLAGVPLSIRDVANSVKKKEFPIYGLIGIGLNLTPFFLDNSLVETAHHLRHLVSDCGC